MWKDTDCRSISDLLWQYAAHRLSEQDRERVESHLARCSACRAEANGYRYTVDALQAMRQQPAPESRRRWQEVQARLSETSERRRPTWAMRLSVLPLTWVGAAGIAAMAWVFLMHPGEHITILNSAQTPTGQSIPGTTRVNLANNPTVTPRLPVPSSYAPIVPPPVVHSGKTHFDSAFAVARANPRSARQIRNSMIRWVSAAPHKTRSHITVAGLNGRRRPTIDYRVIDGGRAAGSVDSANYVLTPVAASDPDANADYVMSGVVMNGRSTGVMTVSDDHEEAHGW